MSFLFKGKVCKTLSVENAGEDDGTYHYMSNIKVDWNPEKPVYKQKLKDKFIFWKFTWIIGNEKDLSTKIKPKNGKFVRIKELPSVSDDFEINKVCINFVYYNYREDM